MRRWRGCWRWWRGTAKAFVACEPRRSAFALLGARMVFALGANDVTRHDAVASVRAGFRGRELSGLWPTARQAGSLASVAFFPSPICFMRPCGMTP